MTKPFSYSQALLAIAIFFLAISIFRFTTHIPEVIVTVDKVTKLVDSISPKVDKIINEVEQVRALVSQQTPEILTRVDSTLPVVQQVVLESREYSSQLPALLAELTKIEQQVTLLQTSMPDILKRVDSVVKGADNLVNGAEDLVKVTESTISEVALWRPHSTKYLEEIELSRVYIPQYLTRIENTVADAKTVGSAASSGFITGFFKGVIGLPREMLSGLTGIVDSDTKSAKHLTADDITIMQETVVTLLNNDNQTTSAWENNQSGNRGLIIKGKKTTRRGEKCINITLNNHFVNDRETLKQLMCVNDEGLWRVI